MAKSGSIITSTVETSRITYEKSMAFHIVGCVCSWVECVLYCATRPWYECGYPKSQSLIEKGNSMKFTPILIMSALATVLSACYVVPMESGSRVVQTSNTAINTTVAPAINTLQARLYPSNEVAQRTGAAQATVAINQSGHGTFTSYIGGEQFTGDATRTLNSRSGKANGVSATGRYINCEYTMNSNTVGTGTCKMSTGAIYNMHIAQ